MVDRKGVKRSWLIKWPTDLILKLVESSQNRVREKELGIDGVCDMV